MIRTRTSPVLKIDENFGNSELQNWKFISNRSCIIFTFWSLWLLQTRDPSTRAVWSKDSVVRCGARTKRCVDPWSKLYFSNWIRSDLKGWNDDYKKVLTPLFERFPESDLLGSRLLADLVESSKKSSKISSLKVRRSRGSTLEGKTSQF